MNDIIYWGGTGMACVGLIGIIYEGYVVPWPLVALAGVLLVVGSLLHDIEDDRP